LFHDAGNEKRILETTDSASRLFGLPRLFRRRFRLGSLNRSDTTVRQAQKQTVIAASEYSKQIQLARQPALEIYDHGFLGNKQQGESATGNVHRGGDQWHCGRG
jgi:hypothetical protein